MRHCFLFLLLSSSLWAQEWHSLAEEGHLPAIQQALNRDPGLLNSRDDEGETTRRWFSACCATGRRSAPAIMRGGVP